MKTNYLLLLFATLLFGCQKDIVSENKISKETLKTITLEEALRMQQNSLNEKKPSAFNILQTKTVTELNHDETISSMNTSACGAIPGISDFKTSAVFDKGTIIRYKFRKGSTYKIRFFVGMVNYYSDAEQDRIDENSFPTLQVGLIKEGQIPITCPPSINLASLNIPYGNIQKFNGQHRWTGSTSSWTFNQVWREYNVVADDCYDMIWFNSLPNDPDPEKYVSVEFNGLSVTEIGSGITLKQIGSLENGGIATFRAEYNGFAIDHPFVWETTGNLIIQGNSTGGSVDVISSNPSTYSGTITATIPGCGVFLEKTIARCPPSNPPQISGYNAIGYDGGTYSFSVPHVHGNTYSWSFSGLPAGATVQGKTTNTVQILIPDRTSSDPTGGTIIMNLTINTLCGQTSASKQITYGVVPSSGGGNGGGPLTPEPVLP